MTTQDARAPTTAPEALTVAEADPDAAAGDSMAVAAWTAVSRVTGVVRVAAIGAVLGATFLGNTFQFTNSLPNIVYYGFLAGSMFSSLLVPTLVRYVDLGDRLSSERIAGGFLGVTFAALAAVLPVAVVGLPWLLLVAAPGQDTDVGQQVRVAQLLILMFAPQVFCYAVVGTATAVMNSRRRFALAAAAPAMENIGILVVLGVTAIRYPGTHSIAEVPAGELLLLGFGTTAAVLLHAAVQWWGARRAGVTLRPRAGWRDPDVRAVVRRAARSVAQTGLNGLQLLAMLAVANRLAGGVVAYQVAMSFYFLPIAVVATPVALAMLPHLARLHLRDEPVLFRDTLTRGYALALFAAIPAAVGLVVLAGPLAEAVSFGQLAAGGGHRMIEVALQALALGVVGQTMVLVATNASYARKDPGVPLRAMGVQASVCIAVTAAALTLHGTTVLVVIGLAWSVGILAGALHLHLHLCRDLPPGTVRLAGRVLRIAVGAAVMAAAVWTVQFRVFAPVDGRGGGLAVLLVASLAGVVTFVMTQAALRSPELAWLVHGLGRRGAGAEAGWGHR